MAEFKVINTQEEFDARIKERLERAEKKAKESFQGWKSPDDLNELDKAHKAEIEKLKAAHAEEMKKYAGYDEKFAEQSAKIKSLEVSALKTRIATEKKLPYDAVEFLQGDDEQSITESADKLSKLSAASSYSGFTRNTEPPAEDATDAMWREFTRSVSNS